MGLHEDARVGGGLDRIENAAQRGGRRVQGAANESGVDVGLLEVSLQALVDQHLVKTFVGERREEATEDDGTESEGEQETKSKTPFAHYRTSL